MSASVAEQMPTREENNITNWQTYMMPLVTFIGLLMAAMLAFLFAVRRLYADKSQMPELPSADASAYLNVSHKNSPTYAFVVSPGHVGTTSLCAFSQQLKLTNIVVWHEEFIPSREAFACSKYGELAKRGGHSRVMEASRRFIEKVYLPAIKSRIGNRKLWEFGHHLICGRYWESLADTLRDDLALVWLGRNRIDTALSLARCQNKRRKGKRVSSQKLLCGKYKCQGIQKNSHALYSPNEDSNIRPSPAIWSQLNKFQIAVWALDELRARWEAMKRSYPDSTFIELDKWESSLQPQILDPLISLFRLNNGKVAKEQVPNQHHHVHHDKKRKESVPCLQGHIEEYERLLRMNYSHNLIKTRS